MPLFQSNLRKQIRKLPKILKSVKIVHYNSLLFICVLSDLAVRALVRQEVLLLLLDAVPRAVRRVVHERGVRGDSVGPQLRFNARALHAEADLGMRALCQN